jgi:integrase
MSDKPTKLDDKSDPGIYFDRDPKSPRGFLLRVTPAGARAWCLNYRVKDTGIERRITIGDVKSWPIAEARKRGHELRREIDAGGDPLADREEKRAAPTVAQLVARFEVEALPSRAAGTQREYRAMLRTWIIPALGRKKVAAVDREDIVKLHRRVTAGDEDHRGGRRRANAVKSLVSTLFNQATVWGMRTPHTNPVELVASNEEHGRERYLTGEEIARLMKVLEELREGKDGKRWRDSVDALALALLTGARRGEILGVAWDQLDLDAGVWTKPAMSTKQRRAHRVPLSADAVALFRRRLTERGESAMPSLRQVFRRGNSMGGRSLMDRDWSLIRASAGLEGVRYHDLRHSFASLLVGEGLSLPIIGKMLGHSKPQTTARYAHLADQPLREAAEIVAGKIGRRPR